MVWHESSARSRELGGEFRKRRTAAGLGGTELANKLGWSASKVSRIESGQIHVSELDAAVYLAVCGVLQDELASLLDMVRSSNERTWVQERGMRLPDEITTLVFHEATAISIASYEPMLIPGLLQTTEYAQAVYDFAGFGRKDEIAAALEIRLERQQMLRRVNPPDCSFFIHEVALRTIAGDRKIMRDQLLQLVFLTSRPQYQIRVVPANIGPHGVWGGMFTLMGFAQHAPMVFVECVTTSMFLEKPADIADYQEVLARLDQVALDAGQSRQLFAGLANDYDKPEGGS